MPEQLELDLPGTARRIAVAPVLRVSATPDGQGIVLRAAAPEVWLSTAEACAMLGMDKHRLYELGHAGEIEGEQPGKPLAAIAAGLRTNHSWRWLSVSVVAYRERVRRAREGRRWGQD